MSHPKLDSESGTVIVVALIATIIGSILAGSYMTVVLSESKNSIRQKQSAQSLFLAEAGIEKGLYYLNHPFESSNPWTGVYGEMLDDPPLLNEDLVPGKERYEVSLLDKTDEPWLPENSYIIRSTGIIPRDNSDDIEHRVSCLAGKLKELPIPAALGILDDADPEDEVVKFQSNQWKGIVAGGRFGPIVRSYGFLGRGLNKPRRGLIKSRRFQNGRTERPRRIRKRRCQSFEVIAGRRRM